MINCAVHRDGLCRWCGNHYASNKSLKVHRYRCKAKKCSRLTKEPLSNKFDLRKTLRKKVHNDAKPKHKLVLRSKMSQPHISDEDTTTKDVTSAQHVDKPVQYNTFVNSDNCTVDNRVFNLHINYNVVSGIPGRLELEEYIKNHPAECLAHYCTCERCSDHGLVTSYTRLTHSANKFIKDVIENGGLGTVDKVPVAKLVGTNSICDQQSTIASRIEMSVAERERKRNKDMMERLCIQKPSDIMGNLKRLSNNIELLYHAIESHLKMGSACRHAFDRNVKRIKKLKTIDRHIIAGTEIHSLKDNA